MRVFSKIADYYELGVLLGEPKKLDGGRSHLLWRINTETGCYVVKKMLPRFEKAIDTDLYRNTQAIAHVIRKRGLSAIAAIVNRDQDVLFFENDDVYMVFPYVDTLRLRRRDMTVAQCVTGGDCLAKLHALDLDVPCAGEWQFSFSCSWSDYIKNLEKIKPQLAAILFSLLDKIESCYAIATEYRLSALQDLVISHRDLDTYNFIWTADGHYYIVDWDNAGKIDAATELMYIAVTWAMESADCLNMDKVIALFDAYQKHRPLKIENRQTLVDTVLTNWMSWVYKQLKRLATQALNLSEQNAAIGEIRNSVRSFHHVHYRKFDSWFCHK